MTERIASASNGWPGQVRNQTNENAGSSQAEQTISRRSENRKQIEKNGTDNVFFLIEALMGDPFRLEDAARKVNGGRAGARTRQLFHVCTCLHRLHRFPVCQTVPRQVIFPPGYERANRH